MIFLLLFLGIVIVRFVLPSTTGWVIATGILGDNRWTLIRTTLANVGKRWQTDDEQARNGVLRERARETSFMGRLLRAPYQRIVDRVQGRIQLTGLDC